MILGVIKEIKTHEYRVGMTPSCVKSYAGRGHRVLIQSGAGESAGFEDRDYQAAGGTIVEGREGIFTHAQMIVKVKEPQPDELGHLRKDQILFCYLHLAADRALTEALLARRVKAVGYETIELPDGTLPCLKPMSEVAGRLSIQEAAKYLEKPFGGRGVLLGGVPGVRRARVTILGGGTVGTNACKIAVGVGAEVTVIEVSPRRMEYLDDIFGSRITTLFSTDANIEESLRDCDVAIGAVLIAGKKAPHLIRKAHLALMKPGAVIVDVAIDQGGCTETSRATTHDDPIYKVDGVIHYRVTNMPGAVSLTSTVALTGATLPYGLMIADQGLEEACRASSALARGVNLYRGACVHENVAASLNLDHVRLESLYS